MKRRAILCLATMAAALLVGSGVALADLIEGNDAPNRLTGTLVDDTMRGFGGDDLMFGLAGNDALFGGNNLDDLQGQTGNDILDGGNGQDILQGGIGDDRLDGGEENDIITTGGGADLASGGRGNDSINARDGDFSDRLICGAGQDIAIVDVGFVFPGGVPPHDSFSKDCEDIRGGVISGG